MEDTVMEQGAIPQEKKWQWNAEDELIITGLQFQTVYNGIKSIIDNERGFGQLNNFDKVLTLQSIASSLDSVFKSSVEKGIIKQN